MSNLKHYDNLGSVRFVTFSCYRRLPLLADERAADIFVRELILASQKHNFKILGYVVMPEHVHLVIHPPDGMKLGLVVREIKSRSARVFFALERQLTNGPSGGEITRVFWNRRCYDHNCRTEDTVREKINYCHANPVRRGLVMSAEDWPWSSFAWYEG